MRLSTHVATVKTVLGKWDEYLKHLKAHSVAWRGGCCDLAVGPCTRAPRNTGIAANAGSLSLTTWSGRSACIGIGRQ